MCRYRMPAELFTSVSYGSTQAEIAQQPVERVFDATLTTASVCAFDVPAVCPRCKADYSGRCLRTDASGTDQCSVTLHQDLRRYSNA